jgi:hypothetical protein
MMTKQAFGHSMLMEVLPVAARSKAGYTRTTLVATPVFTAVVAAATGPRTAELSLSR